MAWEELFGELEAQWDAMSREELATEVADRSRREQARVRLADRLRAQRGELRVLLRGAGAVTGAVREAGPDWLRLAGPRTGWLVPLSAVLAIRGLSAEVLAAEGLVAGKLDFRYALRGLARNRVVVFVHLGDGTRLHGTFDRIGADFAELAEHPPGEPRRAAGVQAVAAIPLAAISAAEEA
jgi:hypothetical protein